MCCVLPLLTRRRGEGHVQQEKATGHDDPATIRVTGAVAVVVCIERDEAWEAATAFWSENKGGEDKTRTRVAAATRQMASTCTRRSALNSSGTTVDQRRSRQAAAQWRPWLAQACATFEDVENNKQSEVAACVVHRAF